MIIEGIRNLLGEDLAKQVEAALKGKGKDGKDVDLVIGNDGTFVPAEKYNGANSGKASAENAIRRRPLFAASSARSNRFSPSDLDKSALIPTPVPDPTAIIMLCSGNASVTAVSACSLICETKMLSTIL